MPPEETARYLKPRVFSGLFTDSAIRWDSPASVNQDSADWGNPEIRLQNAITLRSFSHA